MKKITLLFATMLVMSGMTFGQKEGKVLWENAVDTIAAGAYVNSFSNNPIVSPSGNVFVQYNYILNNNIRKSGIKLYDKNGKTIWDAKDFYSKPFSGFSANVQNKSYTLVYNFAYQRTGYGSYDSTVYLGKDFNFLRKFEPEKQTAALMTVDDGVFYYENGKSLVKYNNEGKEEWRYDSPYQILIQNKKAPYIGSVLTYSQNQETVIILNKDGKKIGAIDPQPFGNIYPANDKGFWLKNNEFEYKKFDSTGRQSANYLYKDGFYDNIAPTVLADNSILLSFVSNNEVLLTKISPSGDIKRFSIPANIKFKDYSNTFIFKVVATENKIMYSLRLQEIEQAEADIKYKIGVVDFDNSANSWSKDIRGGASNGINGNAFTFEAGNTFFQVYSKPDNPPIKTFKIYDINGNLKWESPFLINSPVQNVIGWRIKDSFLYTGALYVNGVGKNSLVKVSCTNGEIIWKKEGISVLNYFKDIQKNNDGNETILYSKDNIYKIGSLNSDGSDKWNYSIGKSLDYFYSENIFFYPTDNGKLVVLSQEIKDNKQQLILRKISPCEALNAISLTGNTEACPTEKVKLSIPKQDGVTYQWQKDGKDLPNLTDAVYDFGESGTYTVVAKDEICQNKAISNALKINIRTLPTAQIQSPKITFCDGEKTVITAQTSGTFFQWQKDEKDIPNATTGIFEASVAGFYRVGVRDDKCPQVGFSNIIPITIKPLPEASISTDIKTVIYEPFTVKMTANSGTALSYQWMKNDTLIPNAVTNIYEAKKSGKYNVSVSKDGCTKTSEALNISIQIALANEGEVGEDEVKIYPNPSRGEFKIILPKTLQNANIQLFDLLGREQTLIRIGEQVQANGLVQGTYFLRVSKGEKSITNKIVIE